MENSFDWTVFQGMAMCFHGFPRPSNKLDSRYAKGWDLWKSRAIWPKTCAEAAFWQNLSEKAWAKAFDGEATEAGVKFAISAAQLADFKVAQLAGRLDNDTEFLTLLDEVSKFGLTQIP